MNREQMIEKAARVLAEQPIVTEYADDARVVVDAILPQVTTVEELGKTPGVDLLVSPDGICAPASSWWSMVPMRDAVIPFPLTVVWQP